MLQSYSRLETKINSLLNTHGIRSVMEYLNQFPVDLSENDILIFDKILTLTTETYSTPKKTIFNDDNRSGDATNARRTIIYLLGSTINMSPKTIYQLTAVDSRKVRRYKKTVLGYRKSDNKQYYKDFNDKFDLISDSVNNYIIKLKNG